MQTASWTSRLRTETPAQPNWQQVKYNTSWLATTETELEIWKNNLFFLTADMCIICKPHITCSAARTLHEVTLHESIRYGQGDSVEKWLNDLLCLDCLSVPRIISGCPLPQTCDLYPLKVKLDLYIQQWIFMFILTFMLIQQNGRHFMPHMKENLMLWYNYDVLSH